MSDKIFTDEDLKLLRPFIENTYDAVRIIQNLCQLSNDELADLVSEKIQLDLPINSYADSLLYVVRARLKGLPVGKSLLDDGNDVFGLVEE